MESICTDRLGPDLSWQSSPRAAHLQLPRPVCDLCPAELGADDLVEMLSLGTVVRARLEDPAEGDDVFAERPRCSQGVCWDGQARVEDDVGACLNRAD